MTALDSTTTRGHGQPGSGRRPRLGSIEMVIALVVLAILVRAWLAGLVTGPRAGAVAGVFLSVVLQALPFLVAGTLATAAARSLARPLLLARWLAVLSRREESSVSEAPQLAGGSWQTSRLAQRPALAVPLGALAAIVPPGDDEHPELIRAGVPAAAVFAYELAASALSPVVLVATAVAIPGHPMLVLARAVAGLLVALGVSWLWLRLGRSDLADPADLPGPQPPDRATDFWAYARITLVRTGGVLVIGAALTALLTVAAPAAWTHTIAGRSIFSVVALALLAVLVCVPAEAGPAVAAMLTPFSLTARLVFLVAGPAVNLRRFSQQSIVYGPAHAVRLAPLTLGASLVAVALVAWML
jgi:uncharacterized membrane protein YraQ (UPF0718 family)